MNHKINIALATLTTAVLAFTAPSSRAADIVASFDANSGASPTLTGYQAMSVSGATMTGTQNSITVAVTGSESFSARDRGVFPGGPLQDMLRDFVFVNDPAPISMTFDLSGLLPNTEYEITTYSYNHGAFQSVYSVYADSVSEPNLIGSKTTTIGPSVGSDGDTGFTFSLTSDVDGKIRFVETAPAGGIVVFNGMTVAEVVAPATFNLTITPSASTPGTFDFSWDSQVGKLYDLVTSSDFATPIASWPVYNDGVNPSYENIPSAGTTTTLTAVVPVGPKRFFAVVEK